MDLRRDVFDGARVAQAERCSLVIEAVCAKKQVDHASKAQR